MGRPPRSTPGPPGATLSRARDAAREVGRMDDAAPERAAWLFFTPHEARTVEAAMARLFPGDELGPGAVEAGAVVYLDRALAGVESDLQPRYRAALAALDGLARSRHGRPFADCDAAARDGLLADLEA